MNKLTYTLNILALSLMPALSFAAPVQFGRIVEIKGSGFISFEGQTHEIKKGDSINVNSEIIVENSGQVTFTDNADHRFFLGSSSTAAVSAGKVELRSGDIWMQSLNKMDDYKLVSANAVVNYQGGEAIFSYDSDKGKTQLMVINGLMKFSNLRSPELNLTVSEGNFSFVDPSYEEGMPRDPTPVGEKSYKSLVSIFPGVSPMDKHSVEIFKDNEHGEPTVGRKVASVEKAEVIHGAHDTHEAAPKKGHDSHGVVATTKKEASELEKEYKSEVMNLKKEKVATASTPKKKTVAKKEKATSQKLVVNIYGLNGSETSATTEIYDIPVKESIATSVTTAPAQGRMPASVPTDTVLDQAVPKTENMNTNPTTPQYKESEKLLEQLNKI